MTAIAMAVETADDNPIDLVEQMVCENDWPFERMGSDDLSVSVAGAWCDYHVAFGVTVPVAALTISAVFDFRVPKARRGELCQLLARVNERLWIGHFDLGSEEGVILYRHGVPLTGGARATQGQCEQMMQAALDACERFYPAFQFVLWGGKSADEAIEAALLDCQGEA